MQRSSMPIPAFSHLDLALLFGSHSVPAWSGCVNLQHVSNCLDYFLTLRDAGHLRPHGSFRPDPVTSVFDRSHSGPLWLTLQLLNFKKTSDDPGVSPPLRRVLSAPAVWLFEFLVFPWLCSVTLTSQLLKCRQVFRLSRSFYAFVQL